jgi:hypothetical protein
VEAIKWFEKNHPEDFDFYGIGWDRYVSSNRYIRYLFRISSKSLLSIKHSFGMWSVILFAPQYIGTHPEKKQSNIFSVIYPGVSLAFS